MHKQTHFIPMLCCTLFFAGIPTISVADSCADIKERYWSCIRASMTNKPCTESDNLSIPPECLIGGTESKKSDESSTPDSSSFSSPAPSFFGSKKEASPSVYNPEPLSHKPVQIVNIKPTNGKPYIETEEEVEQFITKVKNELLNAIKEGKKVRLQFN